VKQWQYKGEVEAQGSTNHFLDRNGNLLLY